MTKYAGKPQLRALYEAGRAAAEAGKPRSSAPHYTDCDKYASHLGAWIEGYDDAMRATTKGNDMTESKNQQAGTNVYLDPHSGGWVREVLVGGRWIGYE